MKKTVAVALLLAGALLQGCMCREPQPQTVVIPKIVFKGQDGKEVILLPEMRIEVKEKKGEGQGGW